MANPNKAKAESGIMRWVDDRFPATQMMQDHLTKYYAPKNFNFFYIFGVLAGMADSLHAYHGGVSLLRGNLYAYVPRFDVWLL